MVADKTGNGTTNVDGISLGFKHALTQIAFKLKGSDSNVNYTVTKLVLKGINNVGTYNGERIHGSLQLERKIIRLIW